MVPEWLNPPSGPKAIVYPAHPTRLRSRGAEFMQFVRSHGYAPADIFGCGPYEDFEGGPVGREGTLWFTRGLQRLCLGGTWVFGISEGTMQEMLDRLDWDPDQNIRLFPQFDPKWDEEYIRWIRQYGDVLAKLRGERQLIVFVGPSAVGKTHCIERLKERHGRKLERVKNVTTRLVRELQDQDYYYLISREEFEAGIKRHRFLDCDSYLGHYYGSSTYEIRKVLRGAHGTCALTPLGAQTLYNQCRWEFNLHFILARPVSLEVLKKNLQRRGITNEAEQERYLKEAEKFFLPASIPHQILELTGDDDKDNPRLFSLTDPLLK